MCRRDPRAGRCGACGFTLVELIVVIGVIVVLIALLLPAIRKARRTAIVLASPVAFVGQDENIHLTDSSGGYDTKLLPVATSACPVCHSPPTWSPSGQLIAMQTFDPSGIYAALIDPFAQTPTRFPNQRGRTFMSWLDDTRFITEDRTGGYEVNVATGQSRQTNSWTARIYYLAPAGRNAPFPFIAAVSYRDHPGVYFLNKDLSPRKALWSEPTIATGFPHQWPRVDETGEFVGWTQATYAIDRDRRIAWKTIHDAPTREPTIVGDGYGFTEACFCDWTSQGEILANVYDYDRWKLVIFNRDGNLVRYLETPTPPAAGVIASWRKYGH